MVLQVAAVSALVFCIQGLCVILVGDNGKENGNYYIIIGYILGLYWGYIGIMEKKMETTGIIGIILGLYRGYIRTLEYIYLRVV